MMISCSGIKSSSSNSIWSIRISVRRSSLKRSFNSSSSVRIKSSKTSSLARMRFSSAINCMISSYSASIFSRSRPVRRCKRISRIACDCFSDNAKRSINCSRAASAVRLPRMIWMTSSKWSSAIRRPASKCSRASAFSRSNCVRRRTISFWCSR